MLERSQAAMTMDLYGHLIDQNLWDAAAKVTPFGPRVVPPSPRTLPGEDLR